MGRFSMYGRISSLLSIGAPDAGFARSGSSEASVAAGDPLKQTLMTTFKNLHLCMCGMFCENICLLLYIHKCTCV